MSTRRIARVRIGGSMGAGLGGILLVGWLLLSPGSGWAHNAAGGSSTEVNDTITSTAYDTLVSVAIDFTGSDHAHQCVATGSSMAQNPGSGTDNSYVFGLSLDSLVSVAGTSRRSVQFNQNEGVADEEFEAVTSTYYFPDVTAEPHTIRWSAKKASNSFPDMVVFRSSLTVVCNAQGLTD